MAMIWAEKQASCTRCNGIGFITLEFAIKAPSRSADKTGQSMARCPRCQPQTAQQVEEMVREAQFA